MQTLDTLAGLGRSLRIYWFDRRLNGDLRRFYGGFLERGDLCFDIGAHVGNRARVMASLGARVVAVEPQALFHRFLRLTLPRRRVTLVRSGVGAREGTLTLHVSRRHPTVSTGAADWIGEVSRDAGFAMVRWDHQETVPQTTLDALIAAHGMPAFCKIDVEGMEGAVLAGLTTAIPCVAFEYLPAALDRAEACVTRLAALGPYRFNAVVGETARFAWNEWLPPQEVPAALRETRRHGFGDLYAALPDAAEQ